MPTTTASSTTSSTSTTVSGPDVHVKLGASTAEGASELTFDFPASELDKVSQPTARRRASIEAAPKTQAITGGGILIKMPPQEVEIQFKHGGKLCKVAVAVDTRVPDDDFHTTCEKE